MSKKKNKGIIYLVLGFVFILGFSILISNLSPKGQELNDITYSQYKDILEKEGLHFVYLGTPHCGFCEAIEPILKRLQEEENIVFNYLNISTKTDSEYGDIESTADFFREPWGTPTLLAINDKEVINVVSGYREIDDLRDFIKESKGGNTNNYTSQSEFNDVTYSQYKDILEKEGLHFVYVGTPYCGFCEMIEPILEELQEEENIIFNYLNISTMTDSEYEDIESTADFFREPWGTPALLVVKNNEVINTISGYREKEKLRDFIINSKEGEGY